MTDLAALLDGLSARQLRRAVADLAYLCGHASDHRLADLYAALADRLADEARTREPRRVSTP